MTDEEREVRAEVKRYKVSWWEDASPRQRALLLTFGLTTLGALALTFTWAGRDAAPGSYFESAGWGYVVGMLYALSLSGLVQVISQVKFDVRLIRQQRVELIKRHGLERGLAQTAVVRALFHNRELMTKVKRNLVISARDFNGDDEQRGDS